MMFAVLEENLVLALVLAVGVLVGILTWCFFGFVLVTMWCVITKTDVLRWEMWVWGPFAWFFCALNHDMHKDAGKQVQNGSDGS